MVLGERFGLTVDETHAVVKAVQEFVAKQWQPKWAEVSRVGQIKFTGSASG